jgi:hypothetical protein
MAVPDDVVCSDIQQMLIGESIPQVREFLCLGGVSYPPSGWRQP